VGSVRDGFRAQDAQALYDLGYACTERGVPELAVRPLALALELVPDSVPALSEFVSALGQDGQHARVLTVLEEHEAVMGWEHRFSYVYNALMAGRLDKAVSGFKRLPEPEGTRWEPAYEKVRRMLARADVARVVTPLDLRDLRGWHYVLTGGILGCLSPWGFDAGMTGRWGYVADSPGDCAGALARLRLVLEAAGTAPASVALLPDRSSRILGTAAAALLGLPTTDFDPGEPAPRSLVVAYDLTATDPAAVAALRRRAPGQVLALRVGSGLLLGAGFLDAGGEAFGERVGGRGPARVDGPAELAVLRRLDVQVSADLDHLAVYRDHPGDLGDLADGERCQFAPAQAAVGGEVGHQLVPLTVPPGAQ
jgi:hypothetical protein